MKRDILGMTLKAGRHSGIIGNGRDCLYQTMAPKPEEPSPTSYGVGSILCSSLIHTRLISPVGQYSIPSVYSPLNGLTNGSLRIDTALGDCRTSPPNTRYA